MKKVCLLTSVHPAFDVRIFHKEAWALRAGGNRVTLIAVHPRDESVAGIRVLGVPRPSGRLHRMTATCFRIFLRALRVRADVYHLHDPELVPFGVLLKLMTRASIILDVHEVRSEIGRREWIPKPLWKIVSSAYGRLEDGLLRFVDHVVLAADCCAKDYVAHASVHLVRNYPRLDLWHEWPGGRVAVGDRRLAYIGAVSEIHGASRLVRALGLLTEGGHDDVVLDLVGPVDAAYEAVIRALADRLGVGARVNLACAVDHSELPDVLRRATVGLALLQPTPQFIEALPTKLFEYMLAGLPVVASSFPSWAAVVEESGCGLTVDPTDEAEIAKAIRALLDDPQEALRMGERGRAAVLESYTWEREAARLVDLYASIGASTRRPRRREGVPA